MIKPVQRLSPDCPIMTTAGQVSPFVKQFKSIEQIASTNSLDESVTINQTVM